VPFALVWTIVIVTAVMPAAQLVAMGTNPGLSQSATPLADSALLFMGGAGALLIAVGSVISMTGNNAGQVLTGSRMLFALAENGELPRFLGRVHPVYRTPANAVLFTSAIALVLAISGSFVWLAVVSAVARLVTYTATSASTLVLRHPRFAGRANPATFVIPLGPLVPLLAIVVSMAILAGASSVQLIGGLAAVLAGTVLFLLNNWLRAARHQDLAAPTPTLKP
jgi:basic amino acid/polyamine antiporter, APA family